jgi:adenine-specific DNA-methyltransferase
MELIKSNQIYIDDIQDATTDASLLKIYENIKQSGFINYLVDIKSIDANIKAFEQLSIDNKKRFLFEILDKNMLYVNQSEINDKNYNVSDTDKKKNKDFYAK